MLNMTELRERAETAVRATRRDVAGLAEEDVQRLVHELQVQEIELEMQNESLVSTHRELEKSREQYRDLYDFAPVGYLTVDLHGAIQQANAAAMSMLGVARARLIGRPFALFVAQEDLQLLHDHLQRAKLDPHTQTVDELRLSRPDRSKIRVRLDTNPAPSGASEFFVVLTTVGRPSRAAEISRAAEASARVSQEIEARVAARTAELEARNRELETASQARTRSEQSQRDAERMQSLGVMAGGIAHDFNNLLVSVLGNADLLLHAGDLTEEARESVGLIKRAARNASDLTRQLLVYAGQGHATMGPVLVSRILKESVELLRSATPSGIDIHVLTPGELPFVTGDRGQIQQVIFNLVRNAIDSMGDQGLIIIRARSETIDADALATFSHASAALPGEFVVLQVQDTGSGIAANHLTHIFDPFFTTKFAGRGLGLASVLGIVQGHHGALRVRTSIGEGTLFELAFPQAAPLRYSDTPAALREAEWTGTGPALLIDDDDSVRDALEQLLSMRGFQVTAAASGEEGLALFGAADPPFQLVVLDWMMPGLGGPDVLAALRAQRADVPVVLVSGLRADTLAVDDTHAVRVQKPMTLAELRAAVRAVSSPERLIPRDASEP
jgi:PAS domain S-box-containing protein